MRRLAQEAGGLRSRTGMQAALLGCVFLGLFTEVLLSPYYPQFFSSGVRRRGLQLHGLLFVRLPVDRRSLLPGLGLAGPQGGSQAAAVCRSGRHGIDDSAAGVGG